MKTLRIVDGYLYINPALGQPVYVSGPEKGGQDVARHLLCEFVVQFQEGNQLMNIIDGPYSTVLTDVLANTFLSEAINRLITIESSSIDGERITSIRRLLTRNIGISALVFYLEVRFMNGTTVPVTNFINLKPTQLNQLLNADSLIGM